MPLPRQLPVVADGDGLLQLLHLELLADPAQAGEHLVLVEAAAGGRQVAGQVAGVDVPEGDAEGPGRDVRGEVPGGGGGAGGQLPGEVGRARGEDELVQVELVRAGGEGDVGHLAVEQGGEVRGPVDVGVRRLGEVVLEQQGADALVEGVVEAALPLEGVALGQRAGFQEEVGDLVVAAETGL